MSGKRIPNTARENKDFRHQKSTKVGLLPAFTHGYLAMLAAL